MATGNASTSKREQQQRQAGAPDARPDETSEGEDKRSHDQQEERERLEEELRQRAKHTTHQKPGQQYAAESDATPSIRGDQSADRER